MQKEKKHFQNYILKDDPIPAISSLLFGHLKEVKQKQLIN
jgi:hypothetical protein